LQSALGSTSKAGLETGAKIAHVHLSVRNKVISNTMALLHGGRNVGQIPALDFSQTKRMQPGPLALSLWRVGLACEACWRAGLRISCSIPGSSANPAGPARFSRHCVVWDRYGSVQGGLSGYLDLFGRDLYRSSPAARTCTGIS
jgi:hypothetical protein